MTAYSMSLAFVSNSVRPFIALIDVPAAQGFRVFIGLVVYACCVGLFVPKEALICVPAAQGFCVLIDP